MGELTLYSSDGEDEDIAAEISAGYDVMFENLKDQYEDEEAVKDDLCRLVETTIFREIQSQSEGEEIHRAIADLIFNLQETDEVDIDSLVQNSIHQLTQLQE